MVYGIFLLISGEKWHFYLKIKDFPEAGAELPEITIAIGIVMVYPIKVLGKKPLRRGKAGARTDETVQKFEDINLIKVLK